MTNIESIGFNMLTEFVNDATKLGICYNGMDIPREIQDAVIKIVADYLNDYEEGNI